MTHCPYCSKELESLGAVVRATQILTPELGWSSIQEIEETVEYYCPECGCTLDFDQASELADAMIDAYEKGGDEL